MKMPSPAASIRYSGQCAFSTANIALPSFGGRGGDGCRAPPPLVTPRDPVAAPTRSTQPPGDGKGFTRGPGGFGGREEYHSRRDIVRLADPAERRLRLRR